jgi:mono/diheme cytochrome c family protein
LESFLRKPAPIRPFGFHPGSGSRMPDFKLAENEVRLISKYLLEQKPKADAKAAPFKSARLSAFAMNKAHTLLKEKLSCLGCHQLGNEGGRIGPNLSTINKRLQPDFVAAMIQEPQATVPHAIMPKIVLPPKNLELITNFLLQQEIPRSDSLYLSLLDYPITLVDERNDAETIYAQQCALCHGLHGEGDGYNAKFLPKPPTKHADKAYLSQRPDDTLYDGIHAGGFILNKSHMMPPWGHTLTHEQIRGLVAHMRKLCGCEGPAWSRDGK